MAESQEERNLPISQAVESRAERFARREAEKSRPRENRDEGVRKIAQ